MNFQLCFCDELQSCAESFEYGTGWPSTHWLRSGIVISPLPLKAEQLVIFWMNRDDFKGWFDVSLYQENIWSQVLDDMDCIIKGRIVDTLRFLWYPHVNWIRGLVGVGQVMDKTVFPQWFLRLQTDRGTMKFWKPWRIKGPSHPTQLNFFANLKRHDVL